MIMFCIGAEYIEHCSDGWFYFFIIQKREIEENFGWIRSVVNSGEAQVKTNINRGFRHFISLGFYYNTFNIT